LEYLLILIQTLISLKNQGVWFDGTMVPQYDGTTALRHENMTVRLNV